ncbi:alpha/beta hydrolase [Bradyrhizobium sp. AUGA SZCCT0182]|uniref:alpha/beta hydrolase n=1 Tax=Bradyrhizobium sp. AUGA SZCCT0182 TaxID=2807667 RepID=UPI001BACA04B|nr:alpha/beta hydrolase [Bradyrhizobium sp. AUGA SZCCT0182]MBR1236914.1 alpha/beta hydrolase [Bradyrhizobium sp. AUGA SZCCT0182]
MYKLLIGLLALLVVAAMIPVAVISFDAPRAPPVMAAMAAPSKLASSDFPAPRQFRARDGANLQYYAYPAGPEKVAILIHGSAGPGTSMHILAESLRTAGVTVYVPDIRGHGGSGRRGDIDYIGQIDDDLADFVAALGTAKSGETRTLLGFSAGAGFAIRIAGGRYGLLFNRYVLLSPTTLSDAPTLRPNAGGWVSVAVPRIITIALLGRVGIHWFDGLPVIRYAISPEMARWLTDSYSYRLATNFGAGRQYQAYLQNIRRPAALLVGDADEQVIASQYAPLLQRLGVNIPVTIVPDVTHTDMIRNPKAIRAIVGAVSAP